MADGDPARWRVTGVGLDPRARDVDAKTAMERSADTHRWVEREWPGSDLSVQRLGDEDGDDVVPAVTVGADDAFDAQNVARSVFSRALPTVTFSQMNAVAAAGGSETPSPDTSCSFCGRKQSQAEKLFAGPGVYICDECVLFMVEIMREESPGWPPSGGSAA